MGRAFRSAGPRGEGARLGHLRQRQRGDAGHRLVDREPQTDIWKVLWGRSQIVSPGHPTMRELLSCRHQIEAPRLLVVEEQAFLRAQSECTAETPVLGV